jgi:hypothetical protein
LPNVLVCGSREVFFALTSADSSRSVFGYVLRTEQRIRVGKENCVAPFTRGAGVAAAGSEYARMAPVISVAFFPRFVT